MQKPAPPAPIDLAEATAALLTHFHRIGIHTLPRPSESGTVRWNEFLIANSADAAPADTAELSPPPPAAKSTPAPPPPVAPPSRLLPIEGIQSDETLGDEELPTPARAKRLATMAAEVADCTRCPELVACRTQTVFGEGNPRPRFVFFGEAPGADEDRTGRPFVGRSGQLLDKMISAMTLAREDIYLLNTVKCRPPGNRNPEHEELQNCQPYWMEQLQILRPTYIVCLGAIPAQTLLQSKLTVGRLRGKLHDWRGIKALVTYHPAYLLRNPKAKGASWSDLQVLMADAGLRR